jgi:predicted lipid-binding transport protein (Tim44 family)
MSPRTRRRVMLVMAAVLLAALVTAPTALAAAGGGSAGFTGGGGGGGGGHGSGFAIYILINLLIHIALLGHGLGALVLIGLALLYFFFTRVVPGAHDRWAERNGAKPATRRRSSSRERQVELAAAEAAEENPEFAPDRVRSNARKLFLDIQSAWDADDRISLRSLVAPELLEEWERRLDNYGQRGWHNRVEPIGEPSIEYVGLTHRGDEDSDRIVVKIDARVRDYVLDSFGRRLRRNGQLGEVVRVREFWTLQRRGPHWVLASIEQKAEGSHALGEQLVATAWGDDTRLRDEALLEGAAADAVPEGTSIAEVADLQFSGDARGAANDLSLADGRFAPDVLEVAARRAVAAWADAIDGDDTGLRQIATADATRELLYAGDTSGHLRMVVRGPEVKRIRIVGLDAGAEPPTMTLEVDISGRRYLEDRDTAAVVAGSRSRAASFTERWTLALDGAEAQPWRIVAAAAPVGLV